MRYIQEKITVKVNNFTEEHFKSIGYNVKNGSMITIPIVDLPKGSGLKIDVECDYCNKIFKKAYRRYLETINDISCSDCRSNKIMKTNLKRYGVTCAMHSEEKSKERRQTFINKYGTPTPAKLKEVQEKAKQTNLKKYGVEWVLQNDEIKAKQMKSANKTLKERGEKYGIIPVSKNQILLHELFGGVINYQIGKYFADIYLEEFNLIIEYDGGGHNLSVKTGRRTQEEFEEKEKLRNEYLLSLGYNILRIIDLKDKFDTAENLSNVRNNALKIFENTTNNFYVYDIENKSELSFKK